MIVVRIEVWPDGDGTRAEELARLHIANDGTGDEAVGSYNVSAVEGTDVLSGRVEGHRRGQGALALVRDALAALVG